MDTSVLAALALFAAEAALGVAALRRARLGLTPLETIAFGAPLGAVLASLLLIPLATLFGLTAATVVGLGAGCAVGAVWLWPPVERQRLRAWADRLVPSGAEPSLPLIA